MKGQVDPRTHRVLGTSRARVYKAPVHMTGLRNAARTDSRAVQDTVRVIMPGRSLHSTTNPRYYDREAVVP